MIKIRLMHNSTHILYLKLHVKPLIYIKKRDFKAPKIAFLSKK